MPVMGEGRSRLGDRNPTLPWPDETEIRIPGDDIVRHHRHFRRTRLLCRLSTQMDGLGLCQQACDRAFHDRDSGRLPVRTSFQQATAPRAARRHEMRMLDQP